MRGGFLAISILILASCSKASSSASSSTAVTSGSEAPAASPAPASATLSLPRRSGPAPRTPDGIPHLQLSDNSPEPVFDALAKFVFSLEHVEERQSRMSLPSSRGAWIVDDVPVQRGMNREFTHLHTQPGPGSQHMAIPAELADEVTSKGWGILHPLNGQMFPHLTLVMVFAPRDDEERVVVEKIVAAAHRAAVVP